MALVDDLKKEVENIFDTKWATRVGTKVPEPEDIKLGNDAVELDAAVLYADLAESTALVTDHKPWFAAEIYKAYLLCACRVIQSNGGVITAFDGDRVMGVYAEGNKNSNAAISALKINHCVTQIINPLILTKFQNTKYQIKHCVGVDSGKLFVARTGIRKYNDLVWVGKAANYSAKLCALRDPMKASWITSNVFSNMNDEAKYASDKRIMWESFNWKDYGISIYGSDWRWTP